MKKKEYFAKISEKTHKRRMIKDYSPEEMEIYRRGKVDALKQVLLDEGLSPSFTTLRKRFAAAIKFIDSIPEKPVSLPFEKKEMDIFDGYAFEPEDLSKFIYLQIADYKMRLERARKIHAVNVRLLKETSQLTID